DEAIAGDGGQRDPVRAVPALHGEAGDAVEAEGLRIGGFDRIEIVVLQRIDDDAIDGLRAIEGDLHPVGEDIAGGIVPVAAVAGVYAGALVVVDGACGIARAVAARSTGRAAGTGERDVGAAARRVDHFRERAARRRLIAGVAPVARHDAVRSQRQCARAA